MLGDILDQEGEDHRQFFKTNPNGMLRFFPEGYERYVYAVNAWADELGVQPDDVEYFLFVSGL